LSGDGELVSERGDERGGGESCDSDMLTQKPMQDLLRGNVEAKAGNDRWEERMKTIVKLENDDGL
jgi:hypothetical protein